MKVLQHPDYATLPIYVAESFSDKAVAGAFFVTVSSKVLSYIAKDAYGSNTITPVMRINKSKYNVEHCVYRTSSLSCSSAKVSSASVIMAQPNSWNAKAWISLCNVDKAGKDGYGVLFGTPYQVMWIPTADGKEPQDLEPVTPPVTVVVPPNVTIPGITIAVPPEIKIRIPGLRKGTPEEVPPTEEEIPSIEEEAPSVEEEEKKAGIPWWLGALLGGGALITVIVFALRDKKKSKKGKK